MVEIVGLLDPLLPPDDVFWHGHTVVQTGEWTVYGDDMRFEAGLIVSSRVFEQWILPRYQQPYVYFHWWLRANSEAVDSDNLKTLDGSLRRLERDLLVSHPQLEVVSGLKSVSDQYETETNRFERVVWVLGGTVLALMVYQVLVIFRLTLDETRSEQAVITSRGASIPQRVALRAAVIGLIAITSVVVGPLLARTALSLFQRVEPLAALSEDTISPSAYASARALAGALAGTGGLCLLLGGIAWYTARFPTALHRLNGPDKPLWQRYAIDLLLIAAGLIFMVRVYYSATGDLRQSIEALWQSPGAFANRIDAGEPMIQGGLGDPLNVIGPTLILVGSALLWLRIFGVVVRLAAPVFRRQKGLVIPLSAWQVGRSVGHNASLAVMLVAALVLEVASLGFDSTYDLHARQTARQETGADVRLEYERVVAGWQTLPGVDDNISVMRLVASGQMTLMGIDPGRSFPGWQEVADQLSGQPSILPGWMLPVDTVMLQLQILTPDEAHSTTMTQLDVQVIDGHGVPFTLPMAAVSPVITGRFITYSAALPDGPSPWRLTGFRLRSEREGVSMFSHRIYLDDLAAVNAGGITTVLEDFEHDSTAAQWHGAISQSDTAVIVMRSTDRASSGATSLSVEYRIRYAEISEFHPLLMVNEVVFPQLPVVVSAAFVDGQQRQSGTDQKLTVGDIGRVQFELAGGYIQFSYRVVGIVKDFPTVTSVDQVMIAPFNDLRVVLNAQSQGGRYYEANQVWLMLDSAKPDAAFRQAAANLAGVVTVSYAWDRYNDLRRDPAIKAVTGILFAAFWFVWGLYAVFYGARLAGVGSQRDHTAHTLSVLGLDHQRLRQLTAAKQVILLVPTLVFGFLVSWLIVYRLLPFLVLIGSDELYFSRGAAVSMLVMTLMLIAPVMVLGWVKDQAEG